MTRAWESYLGNQPALYARKVLKECGLREPPFCEQTVVDYLGLEIRELNHRNVPAQFGGILNKLKTACSWLKRVSNGNSLIYLYGDTITERKRLSVFHECGHFIIPWHEGYNHICTENEIESPTHKRIEREAFGCGNEFLMPMECFVRDGQSLEIGIPAIEQLRQRYVSSFEATAIWYTFTFPGPFGMVMVEPSDDRKSASNAVSTPEQPPLPRLILERGVYSPFNTERYPLSVKYSVRSHFFPKFIKPGRGIEAGNLLFDAWHNQRRMLGEVPAAVFGSSAKWSYNAECLPLGESGKMIVLLWLPDRQMKLNFGHRGLM